MFVARAIEPMSAVPEMGARSFPLQRLLPPIGSYSALGSVFAFFYQPDPGGQL